MKERILKKFNLISNANKVLSIFWLVAISLSIIGIAFAAAPNPGHNFTESSGGIATGQLIYGSAADTFSALSDVAVGSYLRSGGVSTAPVWSTLTLPNAAATGDVLYGSAANTISTLAGSAGFLKSTGAVAPAWSTINLAASADVGTSILPTANGGTGIAFFTAAGPTVARIYTFPDAAATVLTSNAAVTAAQGGTGQAGGYAIGDLLYASGATALSKLADVAAGSYLRSGGVATAPIWSTPTLPNTATNRKVMIGNGTNWVESTETYAVPGATVGNVLTSDGTNWVSAAGGASSYRTILQAAGSHIAGKVAGTYAMGQGDPLAVSGTGTLYPLAVIQIVAADYPTVEGITTKLRIRAQLYVNDVAPTGNFTFGLYPITRPATSGGAGLDIYTLGTVVTGSNGATFTTPAADLLGSAVGADFALPADGPYVIGVVTTATVAASSHLHMNAQLQLRNK